MRPGQIKALRERMGETQSRFASRLGLNQSALSQLESGATSPSGPTREILTRLAEAMNGVQPAPLGAPEDCRRDLQTGLDSLLESYRRLAAAQRRLTATKAGVEAAIVSFVSREPDETGTWIVRGVKYQATVAIDGPDVTPTVDVTPREDGADF